MEDDSGLMCFLYPPYIPATPSLSPIGFIPAVSAPWSIFMYRIIERKTAAKLGQRGINPPLRFAEVLICRYKHRALFQTIYKV